MKVEMVGGEYGLVNLKVLCAKPTRRLVQAGDIRIFIGRWLTMLQQLDVTIHFVWFQWYVSSGPQAFGMCCRVTRIQ